MDDLRIYMRHVRQLRGRGVTCAAGIRDWCARYGISLRALNGEGIPAAEFRRVGGPFSEQVIEIARREAAANG